MNSLQNILPAKLFEALDRAGICTLKQIITLSNWDIKKLTNLCTEDISLVKSIVSENLCPKSITCDKLLQTKYLDRVTTGCNEIDNILNGGYRKGTITEIYGESGCGKTQLAIQGAVHTWQTGSVFICTEDLFPVKRFEQLKKSLSDFNSSVNYGKRVFVEHITEPLDLLSCIRIRLPKLLKMHKVSLIIVDSVAAPFRSETTNYVQRAEELRELAVLLIEIAQQHNLAVICINQVTASFDINVDVLPSLGLAWSNMISSRLWIKKTSDTMSIPIASKGEEGSYQFNIRELYVMFSPDVKKSSIKFIITETGISAIINKHPLIFY